MTKFYTIKVLASVLSVSTKTLQREIKDKRLPITKIRGSIRVSADDVSTYLENCRCEPKKAGRQRIRKVQCNISKSGFVPHIAPYKQHVG